MTRAREIGGNLAVLAALLGAAAAFGAIQAQPWMVSTQSSRWLAAAAAFFVYAAWTGAAAYARRRVAARAAQAPASTLPVWYASQTGTAAQLAERSVAMLAQAGTVATVRPMQHLQRRDLETAARALFVVSTTGEGDAPDMASRFVREVLGESVPLRGLQYGILALGDRAYTHFCGFGHRLDAWLRQQGAQPLFDLVEVDDSDEGALRHWQHHLARLCGAAELPDWSTPAYSPWTLRERRLMNPGSLGGPVFHVALAPAPGTALAWRAGDIAEISPRHSRDAVRAFLQAAGMDADDDALLQRLETAHLPDPASVRAVDPSTWLAALTPLPHREYSIASVPQDGALWLLIRQMRRPDGTLGLGAGWLTEYASPGARVDVRLRANPGFRLPDDDRPLILIGNGTGMAGLRALLRERIAAGRHRNWLLFGERNAACDAFHCGEIEEWRMAGRIARVDWAWSRDGERREYVQERVRDAAGELRRWVEDGAAIYVCGSLAGMAPGVDSALRDVLGHARVDALLDSGRYRRDVY